MSQELFNKKLMEQYGLELTPWRNEFLSFWARQESSGVLLSQANNPFATTWVGNGISYQSTDIGFGPGNWNWVPVKMYLTIDDGVLATYYTLKLSYYNNINKALIEQKINPGIVGPKDFTSWVGNDAYGKAILAHMQLWESQNQIPTPGLDKVDILNEAVLKRFQLISYASDIIKLASGDYHKMIEAHSRLKEFF